VRLRVWLKKGYGVTERRGVRLSISIPREASHNISKNKSKKNFMECTVNTEYIEM
jgi:hypothetical protein